MHSGFFWIDLRNMVTLAFKYAENIMQAMNV